MAGDGQRLSCVLPWGGPVRAGRVPRKASVSRGGCAWLRDRATGVYSRDLEHRRRGSRPPGTAVHDNLSKQPFERRASGNPAAERSEAVRRLNAQIRRIIELESHDDEFRINFYCECGCYEPAELTVAEYDALEGKTVYREGHAPLERHYRVIIHPAH